MNVSPNEGVKKVYDNILQCIGNTPLVKLNHIPKNHGLACEMYAKCEFMNPGGSIKDRIAYTMVQDAEKKGIAIPGITRFVEPTSGNTGIGVSLTATVLGYKCTIVTPDKNSNEKMSTMHLLNSEVIQTPSAVRYDDPDSYISVAKKIIEADPEAISLNQYINEVNPWTHHAHTAVEILNSLDTVDMFVMGTGTGGTVSGVGQKLKEKCPNCIVVAVDPKGSIIFYGKTPVPYFVEGIGGDFTPPVLHKEFVNKVFKPNDYDSFNMSREMISHEGLLCGGSSGAITFAAIEAAKHFNLGQDKKVVVVLPDGIRNYMSKFVRDEWMEAHLFKKIPERHFPWWKRCISNLKMIRTVPTVNESKSCADALTAMGPHNKVAFIINNLGFLVGAVTKDSLRSEATNPKTEGPFDFNGMVGKNVMKDLYKIIENKDSTVGHPTVGLAARILDIAPFVAVVEEHDYSNNNGLGSHTSGFIPKGIITSEIVLDYIIEHQNHI